MKNGEKLMALENVIYQTAKSQFAVNRVSAVEARMVMKAVCERFSELCLETFVLERVSMRPQENQEQQNAEVHTGTPEELMKALSKTGFEMEQKEEEE